MYKSHSEANKSLSEVNSDGKAPRANKSEDLPTTYVNRLSRKKHKTMSNAKCIMHNAQLSLPLMRV